MKSIPAFPFFIFLLAVPVAAEPLIRLDPVASGLNRPVFATHAGDGSNRLFILEQSGRILIWDGQGILPGPFLDLTNRVVCCGERGLLGLAFHPKFVENGRFFVNYTFDAEGQLRTRIAEYSVSSGSQNEASPTEEVILEFDQPFANHNAGMIAFGPDGNLYIATGDGGSAGDPPGNAQNLNTLLGKILRINVDAAEPYANPLDNPFYNQEARNEIWAYGLRNPWRFSFDRLTGVLLLGDVGQSNWEEVNLVRRGQNYGWNQMEGAHCYPPGGACNQEGLVLPVFEYPTTDEDRGVTGGYIYRGTQPTPLWGSYIAADHASGKIWSVTPTPGRWDRKLLLDTALSIVSFGEDEEGELYAVDLGGSIFRLRFAWRELFAHVAGGPSGAGEFHSILTLINPNNEPLEATYRLMGSDGNLHSEGTLDVPPQSAEELAVDEIDFFVGWAEVIADQQFSGSILFSLETDQGEPLRRAGIASSKPGRHFVAHAAWNAMTGTNTGFAVANPSDAEAAVIEIWLQDDGKSYDITLEIPPGGHTSSFASELVESADIFSGTIRIDSSVDVILTTILTQNGIHSASLPVAQNAID